MGYDNFSNAMADYFRKYRWENTEYRDFFDCLQKHLPSNTPFNFDEFIKQWLLTTGVNSLIVHYPDEAGEIDHLIIDQSSDSPSQPLRVRKTKIALFYDVEQAPIIHEVFINAESATIIHLPSKIPTPKAAMINYDDEDYCKVLIHPQSEKFFSENLSQLKDPMVRGLIYRAQ